jgi:hypothetical protein
MLRFFIVFTSVICLSRLLSGEWIARILCVLTAGLANLFTPIPVKFRSRPGRLAVLALARIFHLQAGAGALNPRGVSCWFVKTVYFHEPEQGCVAWEHGHHCK